MRKGAQWLKTIVVQAAWAASRKKHCYFRTQFIRLRCRRGPMKTAVAVAASILTSAYYILSRKEDYNDHGRAHLDRRDAAKLATRLVRRPNDLGCDADSRSAS